MARTDIGRAVPLLKGEYSPTTTYELNDIVSLNGSFYWHYSHEQTTNVAPQATSTWKVVINLADAEAYIARAEVAAESAEDAAEIATAAKTAAESASTTATGASATATAAKNDAVTAKTAAETAQAGAVTAKTAAETARDAAQASATAAGTSATNAGNSAGTAEYYAGIATTAGETASEKATEATGAATTATSAAATATSAKDTAVSSASTASTAATTATSAATAAQAVKDSIPQDYTSLSEDVDDLKTQINDTNSAGKTPFDVHETTVLTANGVESYHSAIHTIYFDVTNTGVYFIHNCNRKSLQATSYAGFDSNGDYVSNGVTIGTRDSTYSSAIIPASNVKRVGISMWNVGYDYLGYVINEEAYVTQITAFDFNANIAEYSKYPFVSNIFNQIFALRGVELMSGSFYNSNEALANYGYIPVDEGDTITATFEGTEQSYSAFSAFINYYASDFTFISSARYGTGVFTIPAGVKYVSIVYFWADNDKCVIKHTKANAPDIKFDKRALPTISSTDYNAYPLYVNIANDVLEVTYKYGNGYDMTVQMQKQGGLDENDNPVGGNQLFDFCRWFKTANSSRVVTDNPDKSAYYRINGTDYFGPYRVRAVNNADGDKAANDDFTGGNHQYNNSGSGSTATARTASIVFSVDGKVVTNFAGYAKTVQVDWINYVQGNNTKKADGTGREILTEHYTIYFDGDKFKVKNVIEALEEICIYTYYGMQSKQMYPGSSGAYAVDPLYYLGSKANRERQPRNTVTSSEDKYCREMLYVGRNDVLDMFMDDVGLGDFTLATGFPLDEIAFTSPPCSAFSSSGKLYFNLIYTKASEGLILNTKDVIYYTGWYQFRPKLV